MATQNSAHPNPSWRFWLLWLAASILGALLSLLIWSLLFGIVQWLASGDPAQLFRSAPWLAILIMAASAASLGTGIGIAQWLVLRRYIQGPWWILATLLGYSVLYLPLSLPAPMDRSDIWNGAFFMLRFGAALGFLQWLVLHRHIPHAVWWIPISIASWLLSFALTGLAYVSGIYVEPMDMLFALIVPVAIAGAALVWLLRRPAPMPTQAT